MALRPANRFAVYGRSPCLRTQPMFTDAAHVYGRSPCLRRAAPCLRRAAPCLRRAAPCLRAQPMLTARSAMLTGAAQVYGAQRQVYGRSPCLRRVTPCLGREAPQRLTYIPWASLCSLQCGWGLVSGNGGGDRGCWCVSRPFGQAFASSGALCYWHVRRLCFLAGCWRSQKSIQPEIYVPGSGLWLPFWVSCSSIASRWLQPCSSAWVTLA